MQEMTITSVHALGPRYAVILKEKDADRYLPILVGASDANAIAIKLHNPQVSLNLTHDLLCTVIDALGGSVRQVLINALQDDILYSKITIQTSDSSHDIDCRPGQLLGLPVDGMDPTVSQLKTDIGNAKGGMSFLQTGDWGNVGEGYTDIQPRRFGANPGEHLVLLAQLASREVYAACGMNSALFGAGDAASTREAWRLLLFGYKKVNRPHLHNER